MEGLKEMYEKFQLTEEEDQSITIDGEDLEVPQQKGDYYLVGKVWIERPIGKKVIGGAMRKIWRLEC